jgi:hypothetical protein
VRQWVGQVFGPTALCTQYCFLREPHAARWTRVPDRANYFRSASGDLLFNALLKIATNR